MSELGKLHEMAKLNVVDDNDLTELQYFDFFMLFVATWKKATAYGIQREKICALQDKASVLSTTCNHVTTCDCAGEGFAVLLGGGQQHLGGRRLDRPPR